MSLASGLYECTISHARTKPRVHRFKHSHFMFYLDLDEVQQLDAVMKWFGTKHSSPYRFEQTDHVPDPVHLYSLEQRILRIAMKNGVSAAVHRITVLTNVRFLEYVFNPVSFFFCFDRADKPLCCIVEVGNTFREKKVFFLMAQADGTFSDRQKKRFYVSPFTELEQDFCFDIRMSDGELNVTIDTVEDGEKVVASYMSGRRLPLTDGNLAKMTFLHPFVTLRVIFLIHFHAMLLWAKGIPFHRKEERMDSQTEVIKPYGRTAGSVGGKVARAHAAD